MRALMRSVLAFGQVVGLMMGSSFTAPADETLQRYPHLRLYF